MHNKDKALRDSVEDFLNDPKPATFADLVNAANIVLDDANSPWEDASKYGDHFSEIRVDIELAMDSIPKEAIDSISGCIGYALKQTIAGESLSEPTSVDETPFFISLEFFYDSTKTQRDDPDFIEAFEQAKAMVIEGTPVRKTDRAGEGTKGTRLVDGLGAVAKSVKFFVR